MVIRKASPADNDRLLEIERHAPQGRNFQLLSERKNYFVRAGRFTDPIMLVAEDENSGNINGVVGVGPVKVSINGSSATGGLLFDGRSNSLVNKGLSLGLYRLWQTMLKEVDARKLDFLFGYIINENDRSMSIALRSGMQIAEEKESLAIPIHSSFFKHLDQQSVTVLPVTDAHQDLADLRSAYAGHDLLPETEDIQLRQEYANRYMRAKVSIGGSSLKIWDTSADYNHRVLSTPKILQRLQPAFHVVSQIVPFPHVPSPGDQLRHWFIYDLIIEKPTDLPILLEKTRQLAQKHQIDFLAAVVSRKESLYANLAKYAWIKQKFSLVFLPVKPIRPPSAPTYLDMRYL
jgi:hypothetical protein